MSASRSVWVVVTMLVVLHYVLHLGLGVGDAAPDLLTVGLLVAAREVRTGTGAGLGFAFGLLEDAYSVLAFGANALALTVVGAVGARTRDLFVGDSISFVAVYFFIGKWARDLLYWIVQGGGLREPFVRALVVEGTLAAGYATAVGLVALTLTGAWWRRSGT